MIDFLHFEKVLYNKLGFYKYLTHDFNHNRTDKQMTKEFIKIGLVSISDRASSGVYEDKGIPSLQGWLKRAVITPIKFETRLIADEQDEIENTLIDLVDYQNCHLILTTGGTGPALRDVTPEATLAVADKQMPGFGEQMRQISLNFVPTALLSRQVAVIRKQCLIINLPGQPKAIQETLEGLKDADGAQQVHGIFAAVPYCLDLIGAPYIETNESMIKAFRPKSAFKPA
jgi:molybdopterin adenylyltransferase